MSARGDQLAAIEAVLAELLEGQRRDRAQVAEVKARLDELCAHLLAPISAAEVQFVKAVAEFTKGDFFSGNWLVERAVQPENERLAAAILVATGKPPEARRVGILLSTLSNRYIDGVRIQKHGKDNQGALWTAR